MGAADEPGKGRLRGRAGAGGRRVRGFGGFGRLGVAGAGFGQGQETVDQIGVDAGRIQEGQGGVDERRRGEHGAERAAKGLDAGLGVGRQQVAVAQKQQMQVGGSAVPGPGGGEIGAAAGGRVGRLAERAEQGEKVALDEVEQDAVDVAGEPQDSFDPVMDGRGEAGDRDVVGAMVGEEGKRDRMDAVAPGHVGLGKIGRLPVDARGGGAQDAQGYFHEGNFKSGRACVGGSGVSIANWPGARGAEGLRREGSSFSEEKEAKRLCSLRGFAAGAAPGPMRWGWPDGP